MQLGRSLKPRAEMAAIRACPIRKGPALNPAEAMSDERRRLTSLFIAIAHLTRLRSYPYEGGGKERLGLSVAGRSEVSPASSSLGTPADEAPLPAQEIKSPVQMAYQFSRKGCFKCGNRA